MKGFREYLTERGARKSLARVMQHSETGHLGIITAHRGEFTASDNKSRNAELAHDLRKAGYGYVNVKGRTIENYGTKDARPVDEHSFLIFAPPKDKGLRSVLTRLGTKYNQDSILYKPHGEKNAKLIGTNDAKFPGRGKEHDLGTFHADRIPEFHSALKGRRTFDFGPKTVDEDINEHWLEFGIYNRISFFSRTETEF